MAYSMPCMTSRALGIETPTRYIHSTPHKADAEATTGSVPGGGPSAALSGSLGNARARAERDGLERIAMRTTTDTQTHNGLINPAE
jgi:hypothetical protein